MIDSYSFGCMVIDGARYAKDLMVLPDGAVVHPWWRKTGHALAAADLGEVLAASPEVLVVGTGEPGLMKPEPGLGEELRAAGIETRVMPTAEAAREYNALRGRGRRVAGCFHLTC
jgi:hypothetical protein